MNVRAGPGTQGSTEKTGILLIPSNIIIEEKLSAWVRFRIWFLKACLRFPVPPHCHSAISF